MGPEELAAQQIRLLKLLPVFNSGGTEHQVVNLLRRIDRERFGVRFACLKKWGNLVKEIEQENVAIDEYPIMHLYGYNTLKKQLMFSRALNRERIQIMHSYNFYANVFGIPAARLARTPVVVASVRDLGVYLTPTQCRLQRGVCRLADRVIVNADAIRKWLEDCGFPAHKITVIHNGVDCDKFGAGDRAAIRSEFGIPEHAPLVVMIARLNAQKGHNHFLEAAARILKRFPETHFLMVGESYTRDSEDVRKPDTLHRDQLAQRGNSLGIGSNLHLTGLREDIPDILAAASVSVLPSFSEGISNTILESMAAGVPVVATDVGGTPEIIRDDVDGILIPAGDTAAIAQAVSAIIENPALADRLGACAVARVETAFSLEAMVRNTQNVYQELLERKGVAT